MHPHAFGFRKKRLPTDATALIAMLIELHNIIGECLIGFGLDYVKCFDLIPQRVVLRVAIVQGMHERTHRALSSMYAQLTRYFKIMGCVCSFFAATNGILQGSPLSVILINLLTSMWKKVLDAQKQATQVSATVPPPRRNSGLCHVCTGGNSTKRRKKMGSSVAYKTIGTFLSQDKRHEDACGWATEMRNSGCAAVRHRPTLCFTHRTCKFDLFLSA